MAKPKFNLRWILSNIWFFNQFIHRTIPEWLEDGGWYQNLSEQYQFYFDAMEFMEPHEYRKMVIHDWLSIEGA